MSPTSLSLLFLIDIIKPIQENSTDEGKIKMYACLGEMEMALPLSFNNNIHLTPFEAIRLIILGLIYHTVGYMQYDFTKTLRLI